MDIISSNNVGKFYRYVNNKLGSKKTVHPTKIGTTNNNRTDNPTKQVNIVINYFNSAFTVDKGQVKPRTDNNTFCDSVLFTADTVLKTLISVKPSISSGPDGIPNVLLKKLAYSICNPLCYIFDSSFKSHCLPSQWLQAFVTPIFKKETTSDPSDYRPISLTCTSGR
jgi:hypothetical protein